MKLEIAGVKPLLDYEKQANDEALAEYNEAKERGEAPDTYDAPHKVTPEILSLEDDTEKGTLLIKSGKYGDLVRVNIEELKRALKVF